MKNLYILFVLLLSCLTQSYGQTYNPRIQNLQFTVPPTVQGFECGTMQSATFTLGIAGAPSATQWQNNPLTISICLTGMEYFNPISTVISGSYAANFNWSFDPFVTNCLIGVQNQTLVGIGSDPLNPNPNASGPITFLFKVPENTALNASLGVNVNLQVPGYMSQGNVQSDDNASIQTIGFCSCYNFITNAGTTASSQSFFFSGDPVAFTSVTPASGGTGTLQYQWEELTSSVWNEIAGETNTTFDAPPTTVTRVYRRKAKRSTCGTWKNSSPMTVSVVTPNAGPDKTLTCLTTSTQIGTPTVPGHTYSWSPAAGLSSPTIAQPTTTTSSTTSYTVTMTNSMGATATDVVVVNVSNSPPNVGTTATSSSVCLGSSTTITGTGASTYFWEPMSIDDLSITVFPTSNSVYTVTGTGANGCVATTTVSITVNSNPVVGSTQSSPIFCLGTFMTLTGTGADIYTWNFGASYSPILIVSPTVTTTYAVIGTNTTTGCTALSLRTITPNPSPNITNTTSATSVCPGAPVTITANGGISYTWQPGSLTGSSIIVNPNVTTTYTVTGSNSQGCTKTSTRLITVNPCGSVVNLKLYIEGYYIGGGLMNPVLLNQSAPGGNSTNTDSITVELRNTTAPYTLVSSIKTGLNTNGTALCNFTVSGNYYLVVKHRNGLQTWSANPLSLGAVPITYDFTTANSQAYGSNQVNVGGNVWALYSGELNEDENIDLLDLGILETDVANFAFGYFATDLNGDGNVDLLDAAAIELNTASFVFSVHP
jgi:hypothetical protein